MRKDSAGKGVEGGKRGVNPLKKKWKKMVSGSGRSESARTGRMNHGAPRRDRKKEECAESKRGGKNGHEKRRKTRYLRPGGGRTLRVARDRSRSEDLVREEHYGRRGEKRPSFLGRQQNKKSRVTKKLKNHLLKGKKRDLATWGRKVRNVLNGG